MPSLRYIVDFEQRLIDAFFIYTAHLPTALIDAHLLHEVWFTHRSEIHLETRLRQAVETNHGGDVWQSLRPTHVGYIVLQKA